MNNDLTQTVERFAGRRVLLVGDFMLDQYVFGDAERISPEAPVPVLRVIERQERVGGAGSVALDVAALAARVVCCGLLGQDSFAERVAQALSGAGADIRGLIRVGDRPTITKTRLVGLAEHRHRQQIIRVDDELIRPPAEDDERKLLAFVRDALPDVDVVCLEDYDKGVLSPRISAAVIDAARQGGKPVFIDPARSPAWEKYSGATLLTPNRAETPILHDHSLNVQPGAHVLYDSDLTQARIGGTAAFKWNRYHPEYDGLPDIITADASYSRLLAPRTRMSLIDNYSYFYAPGEVFGVSRVPGHPQGGRVQGRHVLHGEIGELLLVGH